MSGGSKGVVDLDASGTMLSSKMSSLSALSGDLEALNEQWEISSMAAELPHDEDKQEELNTLIAQEDDIIRRLINNEVHSDPGEDTSPASPRSPRNQ